jgi:Ca-activated chloride channel homolog
MKIDANDPKWTAYALGEITDEKVKAEIESILHESAEMRRLVKEIHETAGLLTTELLAEPTINLTQAQRDKIEAKAKTGSAWFGLKPSWAMVAAAAAILLISIVAVKELRQPDTEPPKNQVAMLLPRDSSPAQKIIAPTPAPPPASDTKARMEKSKQEQLAVPREISGASLKKAEETGTAYKLVLQPIRPEFGSSTDKIVIEEKAAADSFQASHWSKSAKPAEKSAQAANPESSTTANSFVGISSANINLQRDGITYSDTRYSPATSAPAYINPEKVGEFKMVLAPVAPPPPHRGMLPPWQRQRGDFNTEAYDNISDNPFLDATQNPLSTFSIDVDTASYSNMRRFLDGGSLPPKDSIRIEELVNYFDYDYKGPKNDKPFAANFEITEAPWSPEHRLLRIGLKGREIASGKRPNSNLVFLLDVSGSMEDANKLPLVKEAITLLVDQLTESDRVAIVVYASDTSLFLPSTRGDQKEKLRQTIYRLHAGGSTNGASGIQLAYQTAKENFIPGGVNRVILATDGDFNVGITNRGDLTRLIEEKAQSGIFLSALGFGMGNYKDATLETLANKGRGNYAYIDNLNEAKKVLVEQINSTLVTIAKDVKIQVEFNPRRVSSYRLIGYEDRVMAKEDFNNDAKQAGVIGAGHAVTALYELIPVGVPESKPGVDPLKYQKPSQPSSQAGSDELLTVKIRSKEPEKDTSVLSEFPVKDSKEKFSNASQDFKFAASVAAFGMVLRDSPYKGTANLESVLEWAKEGKGDDRHGYRDEFIRLIHRTISISF